MNRSIRILAMLFLLITSAATAQTIIFTGVKTIEYHPKYNEWDEWPDQWVAIEEDEEFSMYISEEVIGKIYKVVLYKNGRVLNEATVRFDGEKSGEIRESWDNEYINCYRDGNGDYIYTQNVSLEQLSKDSEPWRDQDSVIYFWLFESNMGIALR